MVEFRKNARAPVLREADSAIVASIYAGTMCWSPVRPSRMAVFDSHGEQGHAIRCRICPGCLQYERLLLGRRLRELYQDHDGEIFLVCFRLPAAQHGEFARACRRWRGWQLERGFYRTGVDELGLIAHQDPRRWPTPRARRWSHVTWKVYRIKARRRARAFRAWTRGMLTPRIAWGENLNRFHHIGLPALEREIRWSVSTRVGLREAFGASREARAHRLGLSILKPGEKYYPKLISRRGGLFARNAEASALLESMTRSLAARLTAFDSPHPPAQPALRAVSDPDPRSVRGAGYSSSAHSAGDNRHPAVEKIAGARASPAPRRHERLDFDAWAKRLSESARRRRGDPPKE